MTRLAKRKLLLAAMAATLAFGSESVHACAMCYGKSDSPLAAAMNWGIFSLLAVGHDGLNREIACHLAMGFATHSIRQHIQLQRRLNLITIFVVFSDAS